MGGRTGGVKTVEGHRSRLPLLGELVMPQAGGTLLQCLAHCFLHGARVCVQWVLAWSSL